AADPREHDATAGRAEVDGGDGGLGHRLSPSFDVIVGGFRFPWRPIRANDHRWDQRRNAAATPASTGTCNPVVWLSSPAVSARTALATCSGRTSRLSSVRWA